MDIEATGAVAYQILAWIGTLLAWCCLASLIFLFVASLNAAVRARREKQSIRRHSVIPDHPVPLFPPYQGL
jgi:uncharacterized BrkB/YihY/UPF0761 family membrane protein